MEDFSRGKLLKSGWCLTWAEVGWILGQRPCFPRGSVINSLCLCGWTSLGDFGRFWVSVELGECCDILTGCQVLVRELLCSLNEGRGDRNSQDLPVCVCSGFLASKSSWAGLDKSHRVFLSSHSRCYTRRSSCPFPRKNLSFPASKPFVCLMRDYPGFWGSRGVQFANETGFVCWEKLRWG